MAYHGRVLVDPERELILLDFENVDNWITLNLEQALALSEKLERCIETLRVIYSDKILLGDANGEKSS